MKMVAKTVIKYESWLQGWIGMHKNTLFYLLLIIVVGIGISVGNYHTIIWGYIGGIIGYTLKYFKE